MTVRINKSAFNIREKLKELTQSIGLKGSDLMRAATVQEARDSIGAGRKNMVINGQMFINQRNGTNSYAVPNATGGSYGGPDRWAINEATDGSVSVIMDGDPVGSNGDGYGVQEFSKAMLISCQGADTSLASTQNTHFFQNIEGYNIARLGWGTPGAKPVTLSFWVRCNLPGIYCVGLENSATDRSCIREYEVKPGHNWQKVVLTFPGCTDGSWEVTHGTGIRLRFCLASGTQYDDGIDGQWVNSDELTTGNQENFMSSINNRYFITGVQLEVGRVATDFEHRQYNDELGMCMRYYQNSYDHSEGKFPSNSTAADNAIITTSWLDGNCPFPMFRVPMRSSPNVTLRGRESSTTGQVRNNGTLRSAQAENVTNQGVSYVSVTSGTAGAYNAFTFECDSEL